MRATAIGVLAFLFTASPGAGQQAPAGNQASAMKVFASGADVTAMIEKAKRERKPDQAIHVQPILQLAPYTANLEYRVAGVMANASAHDASAELFYVIDGAGTLVTGGTLRDEKRTNATNRTGPAIDGGTERRVAKGDFAVVPEGTPHWFIKIDGTLVMMSLHLPRTAGQSTSR
jgi:mannose-6-phosphate isomerase-like protein (cupin superfamily)